MAGIWTEKRYEILPPSLCRDNIFEEATLFCSRYIWLPHKGHIYLENHRYYRVIETEVRDDDRIRKQTGVPNLIQVFLLWQPIHTISYTIPPLPTVPTGPPQERKLPDGQFCTG